MLLPHTLKMIFHWKHQRYADLKKKKPLSSAIRSFLQRTGKAMNSTESAEIEAALLANEAVQTESQSLF